MTGEREKKKLSSSRHWILIDQSIFTSGESRRTNNFQLTSTSARQFSINHPRQNNSKNIRISHRRSFSLSRAFFLFDSSACLIDGTRSFLSRCTGLPFCMPCQERERERASASSMGARGGIQFTVIRRHGSIAALQHRKH